MLSSRPVSANLFLFGEVNRTCSVK